MILLFLVDNILGEQLVLFVFLLELLVVALVAPHGVLQLLLEVQVLLLQVFQGPLQLDSLALGELVFEGGIFTFELLSAYLFFLELEGEAAILIEELFLQFEDLSVLLLKEIPLLDGALLERALALNVGAFEVSGLHVFLLEAQHGLLVLEASLLHFFELLLEELFVELLGVVQLSAALESDVDLLFELLDLFQLFIRLLHFNG